MFFAALEIVTDLTSLEYLQANGNGISFIPESIQNLTNLKTLSLSRNFSSYFGSFSVENCVLSWLTTDQLKLLTELSVGDRQELCKELIGLMADDESHLANSDVDCAACGMSLFDSNNILKHECDSFYREKCLIKIL